MSSLANMKIGVRLGLGFGLVLLLLAVLIAFRIVRLSSIDEINHQIIAKDWVKADAAHTINAAARANARRNMELLVVTDKEQTARIREHINTNRKTIDQALETLGKLAYAPKDKDLLARIKDTHAQYVASFTKVGKLVDEGLRDDATRMMLGENLPVLDVLQDHVKALVALQKELADAGGAKASATIESARTLTIGMGLAALLVGIGFAFWVTRSITRGLGEAVRVAQTVAAGDLTSTIEVGSKDEIGQLMQALKDMNASLVRTVSGVQSATESITAAAKQIAAGNADLSQRTEKQASSLEETASSMEELTSTVKQNAENAKQANQLAIGTRDVAMKGGKVVSQVVDTMTTIRDSSEKIVDIISVIEGIAFQTNILALNAAVEAARAGEQGRGFAVVAGEVRSLAQRSSAAAKEIKALIGDSVAKVGTGSQLVVEAGRTMEEIVQSVKRVTDIMGEISAASQEQSSGIEQVNQAVTQMDKVTQQNAALVEEAAAAAEALEDQAERLRQEVRVFKLASGAVPRAEAAPPEPAMKSTVVSMRAGDAKRKTAALDKAQLTLAALPKQAGHNGSEDEEWAAF